MSITQSLFIPPDVQQLFIDYHRQICTATQTKWDLRSQMRKIDLAYLREGDLTQEQIRAKLANAAGDPNKIQNITLPIIKPQINAAVAYQAAVFLSEYPIFGLVSTPNQEDAALQMQALLEENSIRGGWARELMLFFFDGFKYNLSAVEVTWDKVVTAAIETDITYKRGLEGKPKEVIWEGNCLRRWDLYNTYFDPRVVPYEIPTKGEFAGHTELYSKTALKTLINSLETKLIANVKPAFESPSMVDGGGQWGFSYYIPDLNPDVLIDRDLTLDSWDIWAGLITAQRGNAAINYRGIYEVSTEYIRIIPSEFGLKVPAPNTPQIWKLIIVNHSVIVYAERQTNAHEKIPVFFGCPSEDGLAFQTKSLAQDALPFQQISSALMNSVLASRRRAISDRVLYDPSRVSEAHMNNPSPSAKIPVRPAAYGKPVAESVYQFPFRDDQAGIAMQEVQAVTQFGNVLNGQNQARQGQFVKGNKTDSQWESTMTNATSKDQMTSLLYEAQVFTPLKEVLKLNYLQYQGGTSIYSPNQSRVVNVDPIALRNAVLAFKVTDGYLPTSKVISKDALQVGMQIIGTSQSLAQGYNIAPMFSYLMKTENVDFTPFQKSPQQLAYEQALNAWSMNAQLAIQKGVAFNIPQPLPQQFGYDPQMSDPEEAQESQQTPPQRKQ